MYCPKCGKENPDEAQFCNSCGAILAPAPATTERPLTKTSDLAIASFVLGILSLFAFYFTALIDSALIGYIHVGVTILAVALGIISLVQIGISAGRVTGSALATTGIIIAVLPPFLILARGVFHRPTSSSRRAFHRPRSSPRRVVHSPSSLAFQTTCRSNLSRIGKAMLIYANDYEDELPRAGGSSSIWGSRVNWDAPDRFTAYSLAADGSGGMASISASLYLLIKYAEVAPKSFVCPYDYGTTEFNLYDYPNANAQELIDAWDFGPSPARHCSYSYHIPYGLYALTTSSEPGMAVAADRNPWIDSPAGKAKDFALFRPDTPPWNGTIRQAQHGNARAHAGDGQNVLFLDSHVEFATRAYCGVEDDNIYTHLPQGLGHPEVGEPPVPYTSQPGHKKDSFLLHDPPARAGK